MVCLTPEQIAQLSLGLHDGEFLAAHVVECDACRAKLVEARRLTQQLSDAHAQLDRNHAASRARLLASLNHVETPAGPTGVWTRLTTKLSAFAEAHRFAIGGVGLSTAVAVLLLFLALANSPGQLSAMERMIKQLREVTSFTYDLEETTVRARRERPTRIQRDDKVYWQAPASLRASLKMVKLPEPPPPGDKNGELLADIVEIYTAGQQGILIDYKDKTFFRTPELRPDDDFGDTSPVTMLRKIAKLEGAVTVVRDLGIKPLRGKMAHGYVMSLANADPDGGQNAIHVWLDPESDLPMEFSYEEKGDLGTDDAWTNVLRVTNCHWNIDLDPKLFDTTPPNGYINTTPPTDEKGVHQIIAALQLYAELSGGRYPSGSTFDAEAVHEEMLKLAGFTGPPQAAWSRDESFQQIQKAEVGLDWIARIVRGHKSGVGYFGKSVGAEDKEKILLWWNVAQLEPAYRVIYGDLRTEIVSEARWQALIPSEAAGQ